MPKWLYQVAYQLQDDFNFYFIATHSDYVRPEFRSVAKVAVLPFNKWVLAAYLRWNRIDIAQVANLGRYKKAAFLAGVPVVIERTDGLRGGTALTPKDGLDAVIASTKGVAKLLRKMMPPQNVHLIYNGFDINSFSGNNPERFGFSADDLIVGRTSRLVGGKNISMLIEAVIEIRKEPQYQHVRLVICGGDNTQQGAVPMLEKLMEEAKPLGSSAVFTGEIFDTRGVTLGYNIATCTSNSNNEGIPNSLIEAMAAGKPVVATAVDDIPELVINGKQGFLVNEGNCDELVNSICQLVDNPSLREQMGEEARYRIETSFNMKMQIEKYRALYTQLLEEAKSI